MLLYLFWYLLMAFLGMVNLLYDRIAKNRMVFFCIFVLLVLMIGCRATGYDYWSYIYIHKLVQSGKEVELVEPGFLFVCSLFPTYRLMFLGMAFLTVAFNVTFLYKKSPLFYFSLFLLCTTFLFPTFMGQMRQGVALGIMAWAVANIQHKKRFFLLLALATCFHVSALLGLLVLFIPKKKRSLKYYLISLFVAFLLGRLTPLIVDWVLGLLSTESLIWQKLFFYTETQDAILGINTAVLIRLVILFLCYWRMDKIEEPSFPFLVNIYHYSILLYMVLGFVPQMAARGSLYFSYYELLLVPFFILSFTRYNRLIVAGAFILLSVLRFVQFFMDDFNYSEYVPYLQYL